MGSEGSWDRRRMGSPQTQRVRYMMKLEQTEQQQHKHCVVVPTVTTLVHLSPSKNHEDEKS